MIKIKSIENEETIIAITIIKIIKTIVIMTIIIMKMVKRRINTKILIKI